MGKEKAWKGVSRECRGEGWRSVHHCTLASPSTSALLCIWRWGLSRLAIKGFTSVCPNTVRLATKTQGDTALRYGEKQPFTNLRDRLQERPV